MEPRELMTKRKIEMLASQYEGQSLPSYGYFASGERFDVFVSHSSADNEFIRKVLLFLYYAKGGIHGYVDWQDPEMRHTTDAQTAMMLKERILRARKLIYVVTNDSLKSVWCSYELGFADCAKGIDNIALLAIKPNNGYWKNNEYLQQYPWISYVDNLFQVTTPDGRRQTLYSWLSTKE